MADFVVHEADADVLAGADYHSAADQGPGHDVPAVRGSRPDGVAAQVLQVVQVGT
jgi:hypothetical protein